MEEDKKIFITTTLPYVNSIPHIGHAFEFILGDVIARFFKWSHLEDQVVFNIGLDEHGLKVWQKAQELGITPEEHIQNMTEKWLEFCELFFIKPDIFYKTSTQEHHRKVSDVWNHIHEKDFNFLLQNSNPFDQQQTTEEYNKVLDKLERQCDIYRKSYKGLYCVGCESFKQEKDLINNKCPDHATLELKEIEEENYFFNLTKYKEKLLAWLDASPDFLTPSNKKDELRNLIVNCEDISISRKKENCPWGVITPGNPDEVIYVWFDALLNYIFAAGSYHDYYTLQPNHWDYVVQLCGPDNLRFQGVIFQGILASLGIKHTDRLLVHGTINDANGKKMSKSTGNVVDPIEQLNKYGLDAVRYYACAGLSTYTNSNWNEKDLVNMFNADICDDYGNLLARVLHLVDTKFTGELGIFPASSEFLNQTTEFLDSIDKLFFDFQIRDAYRKVNELVKFCNNYINETKPWAMEDGQERNQVLSNLYWALLPLNNYYNFIFPHHEQLIEKAWENKKKVIVFNKIK